MVQPSVVLSSTVANLTGPPADKWPWLARAKRILPWRKLCKGLAPAAFVTYIRAILLRDTGATLSPVNAYSSSYRDLETLSLRVERHVENASEGSTVPERSQPLVEKVNHPSVSRGSGAAGSCTRSISLNGGGSIFTFEIKGGRRRRHRNSSISLELFSLLANVADVKSLAIHPASTTHSECNEAELLDQGIKPNTIRLSIGTENVDDIIEDLDEAFKAVQ